MDPARPEEAWRIVSSIFLHGGFEHLFFNALALFFFGPVVERTVGRKEFYKIFFIGGIVGSLFYLVLVFVGFSPPIPALGASGAIYGVLGAAAFFHPNLKLYFYFVPMELRHAVILWIVLNIVYIIDWSSGIGGAAHLGGLFSGWVYAKYLEKNQEAEWKMWEKEEY